MTRSPSGGDPGARQPKASGDTIVALSSGRPPAAVAIIRTSGPQALPMLEALTGRALPGPRRATLRQLSDPSSGEPIDRSLVLFFPAPASATGEDVVEDQCHGGRAVVERLLAALVSQEGARLAQPGEFTRRALANGRIDLTEAEGLADLIEAETEAQRRAALSLSEGGLRRQAGEWRTRLIDLSARTEAAIDYVGDEDETAVDDAVLAAEASALADHIEMWLAKPRAERLKEGVRIVVAGPPNAGKSSLVNALSGIDRSIVTDIPGTTRDTVEVSVAVDGLPFVLVDTAGLRESEDEVEQIGIGRAEAELARADIVLWLGEPADRPGQGRLIQLYPRIDLPGRDTPAGALGVSSVTGEGIAGLWKTIHESGKAILPVEGEIALNQRQADCLATASDSLRRAGRANEPAVLAHEVTAARQAIDRLTGAAGIDDVLDALFSRFCLGK